MDRIEILGKQLSQITMYDIKTAYNQAKNMVLNVSEMEAKVQEATNDDPWGASSTLMSEIAQGTFNFQHFNEIMPAIYSRFMDKEAREWRQIYKALQLLEYIIKHGSERVVDDARSHLSTLKMLRNFHYIDERGKDQGINVRNRAKEIAELLSDLDRVRQERRKAKVNKTKYTGMGSDGASFGSGGRYGGFSSEDYYASGGGSYSGGGGGGGGGSYSGGGGGGGGGGFSDSTSRKQYEEYDAGEWEDSAAGSSSAHRKSSSTTQRTGGAAPKPMVQSPTSPEKPAVPAKDKAKEVDLLSLGFDDPAPAAVPPPIAPAANASAIDAFDEFDDFQSAPAPTSVTVAPPTLQTQIPKPSNPPTASGTNVFDLLNATQPTQTQSPAVASPMAAPMMARPSYGGGMGSTPLMPAMAAMTPTTSAGRSTPSQASARPAATTKASSGFDDLWSSSLTSTTGRPSASTAGGMVPGTGGKSIMDLQKEKSQAAFWGAASQPSGQGQARANATFGAPASGAGTTGGGSGLDDLLF